MPYFGTDYGICSIIKPQLVFNPKLDHLHYYERSFGNNKGKIEKGAKVGNRKATLIINYLPLGWKRKWTDYTSRC